MRFRARILTLALVYLPLATSIAYAQEQPRFKVSTRLVEVGVVVTDRVRQPVVGLTAADFRVFEDGKEQKVALLSVHDARTMSPSSASAHPVNHYSNQVPATGAAVTALLFDALNTSAMAACCTTLPTIAPPWFARWHVLRQRHRTRSPHRTLQRAS